MRNLFILSLLIILVASSRISFAQSVVDISSILSEPSIHSTLLLTQSKPEVFTLNDNKSPNESTLNKAGFVAGALMITGGAALFATGHVFANQYYEKYKKSAFTENTDMFREKVTQFSVLSICGAGISSIGLLTIIISF